MEVEGELAGPLAQPVRNELLQGTVPAGFELGNLGEAKLVVEVGADGVGVRGGQQVGADSLDGTLACSSGHEHLPEVVGVATVAFGVEREVLADDAGAIMKDTRIGELHRAPGQRFAFHGSSGFAASGP
jgi:hypothetical protein